MTDRARRIIAGLAAATLGLLAVCLHGCAESPTNPVPRPGLGAWQLVNPTPLTTEFQGVWGDDIHDIWAVGEDQLVHCDGQKLTPWRNPLGTALRTVGGFSRADVYAAGDGGTMLHFGGGAWQPIDLGTDRDLLDLVCLAGGDIVVVGDDVSLRRHDGQWREVDLPAGVRLRSVWTATSTSGAQVIYAAGRDGIFVLSGAMWIADDAPAGLSFVAGSGDWALASDGTALYRRGAAGWQEVRTWPSSQSGLSLLAQDEGVLVGRAGAIVAVTPTGATTPVWSETGRAVTALDAVAGDPLQPVAVGSFGTVLLDRDPAETYVWAAFSEGAGFAVSSLQGVACTTVVGLATDATFVVRFNGTTWTAEDSGLSGAAQALWPSPTGTTTAVGLGGRIARRGLGGTWQIQETGTSIDLFSVWGTSSSDVFAGGENGAILHYDGNSWRPMDTVTDADVILVSGLSPEDVWALDRAGAVAYYNGRNWSQIIPAGPRSFDAVTAVAADTVLMVAGVDSAVTGLDGVTIEDTVWQLTQDGLVPLDQPTGIGAMVRAMSGQDVDDLWAATDAGLVHRDVGGWRTDVHLTGPVTSVWTGPGCGTYVSTAAGIYWNPER